VIAWDIGSRHDHSVGIVLDVTQELFDVACYVRFRGDYPQIQRAIEDLHAAFARASFTVIENNSTGAAVADNVTIPAHQLRRFTTSSASKERIIEGLRLQLELQLLSSSPHSRSWRASCATTSSRTRTSCRTRSSPSRSPSSTRAKRKHS
jgi:hypothetical protein